MTLPRRRLPDGFVVRLHDDVQLDNHLVAGTRVLKLSEAAKRLVVSRSVTVDSVTSATFADRLLDLDLVDPVLDEVVARVDNLTVVVPVHNNAAGVERLIAGLGALTCVVVDDASADPQLLAKVVADHGARLVRLNHNVGPAAARNAGLREVATPYVAFVDSDVEVSVEALAELTRHFHEPRLAAVAPRVTTPTGGRWFQRYEHACGSLDLGARSATVRPWSPVSFVPSACLVARVDALGDGFDPRLRSGEDVDLVWRLQADGLRVRYAAEVSATHASRSTVAAWLARKAFYGTSAARLASRHGDRVAPAALTTSAVVSAAGFLIQRRWSVLLAGVGSISFVRSVDVTDLLPPQRVRLVTATGAAMTAQLSGLALRHWWPASLVLATVSRRARRALVVAAVVDGLNAHRSAGAELDPVRFLLARRLDDVAYGAGVWWGAARVRSAACLLPRWVRPGRPRAAQ